MGENQLSWKTKWQRDEETLMAGFDTPFRRSELVGFFTWDAALTESLCGNLPWLYHACHEKQFRLIDRLNSLFLRSSFEVKGGKDGCESYECVWTSLQPWHTTHGHNHFGPITVKMPLGALDGRRFYVFRRELNGWGRFYVVQRQAKCPLFGMKHRAKKIAPSSLFQKAGPRGGLDENARTQYEIVLTEAVPLTDARFIATDHEWCALGRCSGARKDVGLAALRTTVQAELARLANRYPQMKRRILAAAD